MRAASASIGRIFQRRESAEFRWTTSASLAVLYLAVVGTIAAFWLYYWLLQRVESTKAMTIALVTPLVAVDHRASLWTNNFCRKHFSAAQ
jgi:drug/metabolite transporter (DMT)-like permease